MNDVFSPSRAYDLLELIERQVVDDYVTYVKADQKFKGERIALALNYPIPTEYIRRSKGLLNKPLVRAAVAEKIQAAADDEDMSPVKVIQEYIAIATANLKDYVEPTEWGEFKVKHLDNIPREKMGAVKTIRTVPTAYGNKIEVVLHDKHPALKALAELMGLVSPDKPPILEGFSKPKEERKRIDAVPEKAYADYLENMGA